MQKQESDKLEEMLKTQLSDAECAVPELVWNALEEELFPEKKRRFFIWWWLIFAELAALLIALPLKTATTGYGNSTERDSLSNVLTYRQRENDLYKFKNFAQQGSGTQLSAGQKNHPSTETGHPTKPQQAHVSPADNSGSGRTSGLIARKSHQTAGSAQKTATDATAPASGDALSPADSAHTGQYPAPQVLTEITSLPDTLPLLHIHSGIPTVSFSSAYASSGHHRPAGPWSLGVNAGYDFFSQTVFRDFLQAGQLSRNSYRSTGFELSAHVSRKISSWLSVELFGAFNQKRSGFVYDILVDRDTYFSQVLNGEWPDISSISSSGPENCYYLRNASASYTLSSWLGGLNMTADIPLQGRLGLYGGAGGLGNFSTSMTNLQTNRLIIAQPGKESFSYLQLQASGGLSYKLSGLLSLRIGATYRHQLMNNSEVLSRQHSILIESGIYLQFRANKRR